MPAAAGLIERAASLLPATESDRLELLPLLGAALTEIGDFERADRVLADAISASERAGDRRSEMLARLHQGHLRVATGGPFEQARDEAKEYIASFEELGDHAASARAWQFLSLYAYWDGQCAASERAYERSVEHARSAPSGRRVPVPWWAVAAPVHGPTPVAEAEPRCVELGEQARGDRFIEGMVLIARATFAAMSGRADEGRSLAYQGKHTIEELGMWLQLAGIAQLLGYIERLCGDELAAERAFREGYEISRKLGETGYLSVTVCYLGESAYGQGRHEEALRLSEESEEASALDDVMSQCEWRALRATVLAGRGELEQAERLARDAVELVRRTDYIDHTAQILTVLGEVVALAGREEEAHAVLLEAIELYEQKGNIVSAARVRERLVSLGSLERE